MEINESRLLKTHQDGFPETKLRMIHSVKRLGEQGLERCKRPKKKHQKVTMEEVGGSGADGRL